MPARGQASGKGWWEPGSATSLETRDGHEEDIFELLQLGLADAEDLREFFARRWPAGGHADQRLVREDDVGRHFARRARGRGLCNGRRGAGQATSYSRDLWLPGKR